MMTTLLTALAPTIPSAPCPHPIDERLMEMIQARDPHALRLLYDRYATLLKSIGRKVLNNDADAEDLLQEVFSQVWARSANYNPSKGRPLGWIVTLTHRRAIDRLRKREAYCRVEDRFAGEVVTRGDTWTHVHEDVAQSDTSNILKRALATLPEPQRIAIQLAYYGEMTQREVAASTGIPLGTTKTRLDLGLKKMAAFLAKFDDLLWTRPLAASA